jgi:Site-specific recombinase XerD
MDTSNLQKNHPLLLEYLRDNGYSRASIKRMKRCIKLTLNEGSSPEIESYEQLYLHEMLQRGYKNDDPVRQLLKSVLGNLKRFDLEGVYPQFNYRNNFMASPKKYDLLNDEYKSIIDHYEHIARSGTKIAQTIYIERLSGVLFLLHLQNAGAQSVVDVTERTVLDFFFDGEKIIRCGGYKDKVATVLKTAIELYGEPVMKLLSLLPSMPKSYPSYPYLTQSESEKFRIWLEEENSQLTLLDKAIAIIAYYTGLRGTDILSLMPENIDWEKETINLVQSKTGVELTLPMSAMVGNAIWDYLIYERPKSKERNIFIKGVRPYDKISGTWRNLKKVFNEAGVRNDGGRTGVRIFRHHLATALLKNQVSSPVISSILGHTSPESINPYVDADIEHLRECSLSIEDFPVAKEVFEL